MAGHKPIDQLFEGYAIIAFVTIVRPEPVVGKIIAIERRELNDSEYQHYRCDRPPGPRSLGGASNSIDESARYRERQCGAANRSSRGHRPHSVDGRNANPDRT